ncbi:MAG: transketolase [Deltaproteobacteria bacterium]|nr:transketolase [Deltaproteobacteria bacterium]
MSKGQFFKNIKIHETCINTIRTLAMDAVQKANSGHPGAPMGLASPAYLLWSEIMRHNPENPDWFNRDRFVLSGGHASMLLYSLLHLTGYGLTIEELKNFRQIGSKTPGHPEFGHTVGVETTTGPLGQGFTNAVGMALAERHLASIYNRPGFDVVDHFTYVMCGDGDLMEGITSEAASFAGHMGLSRLICIYDDNGITIEGKTDLTFTEDIAKRFEAYNWHVQRIVDGNDLDAINDALENARDEKERPSIIITKTHIAYGSPNKQDTSDAHGSPLGEEEVRLTKKNLGWPETESFYVPREVSDHFKKCMEKGKQQEASWNSLFNSYKKAHPDLAEAFINAINNKLGAEWENALPDFSDPTISIATRAASGKVLNAIAMKVQNLVGGSADLAPSNNTMITSSHDMQKGDYTGRNIRFGVREHAMGGILSGLALHKGLLPFGGTFLVFADYMRPSIRLAALMKQPVKYIFTHDSIAVGEDGPTHQPVEQIFSLRSIPGLIVIRPSDATETTEAWRFAIKSFDRPVALILSRQNLPVIDRKRFGSAEGLAKGAYILADTDGTPDVIIIATGSEVNISLKAKDMLLEKGIRARVVSMPSMELFRENTQDYRDKVLPPTVKNRVVVEAGLSMGWERYAGEKGIIIGIDTFGASAPGGTVMKKFGFTAENIVEKVVGLIGK